MSSKLLLLFLGTFLLVQSSFGKALPSSEESTETVDSTFQTEIGEDERDEVGPSDALFYYVLVNIAIVSESGLEPGKKLLQHVIAEISALDDKNEEITARLEEYSNLVAKIQKQESEGNSDDYVKIELMADLGDLLDKSNLTLIEEPTSIDKLFEESLEKNGLSDLDQLLKEKFEEVFAKEFYETVDRILKSATIEEWPEKTEVQDWLEMFKMENNLEKKSELLEKFFDFYQ